MYMSIVNSLVALTPTTLQNKFLSKLTFYTTVIPTRPQPRLTVSQHALTSSRSRRAWCSSCLGRPATVTNLTERDRN